MNKKVTPNDIKHIAGLARLTVNDTEIEKFSEQLSEIVEYVATLQSIETEALSTDVDIIGAKNVYREDEIVDSGCLKQDEALQNASSKNKNKFKVKVILEQ